MKNKLYFRLIPLFVIFVFTLNTLAPEGREQQLPEGVRTLITCSGNITGNIQFSPDGKELAVSTKDGIWLYDARTGAEVALLTGHKGGVNAVSYSPKGKLIASAGLDETVRLWDAKTWRFLPTLRGHYWGIRGVVFSPDGKTVVSAADNRILFWDWKKLVKTEK